MESQQRSEIASKQAKAEAKIQAQEKKTAKAMQPRKEDVSQLIDDFFWSWDHHQRKAIYLGADTSIAPLY